MAYANPNALVYDWIHQSTKLRGMRLCQWLFTSDVHVPRAIRDQLRLRQVDVLTAQEDGKGSADDEAVLQRSTELGRLLFTQDIRFKARAYDWQRQARAFSGLAFGHQQGATIGQYVADLELIAKASEPQDWLNRVEYLPYPRSTP